ncbi:phosphoribosyltransferase [Rickettsiales endosymbiont of Stachyamoeba lipophora]|uniref:phosphoribosyltransferase n=1 Tax=Rickettsiales endosymbiont of Stachyamoeba lipophora TaxID=2486578 RepID=UPI000F652A02|nr:phosphoribosyltransferase [Rickettsiales endosymbiont of Stachyamoeba lipophora]AZL16242.1 phosphoribosyltransferase [Rickettsiales endosymbiont of Stachyamoeba lipophora]
MFFKDREDAGKKLAGKLRHYVGKHHTLILALPRGGVPVAHEVARSLNIPFDVFIVRKLGTPRSSELAMGAITLGGHIIFNEDIIQMYSITPEDIKREVAKQEQELQRRNELYRSGKPFPNIKNQIIILIDDGIATGATISVAVKALKEEHPAKIIIATPIAPQDIYEKLKKQVDEVICLDVPEVFYGVGQFYQDFSQTSDEEVIKLLENPTAVND